MAAMTPKLFKMQLISSILLGLAISAGVVSAAPAAEPATPTTQLEQRATKSTGCGKSGIKSGTYSVTIDGTKREYILSVPSNYKSSTAYKLVFAYHWSGGSASNVANGDYYGLKPLSDDSTIFVAPNGLDQGWANTNKRDLHFTDSVLSTLEKGLCIDKDNIFATGWSYGGGMSYEIACAHGNSFKAVAIISGAQLSGCDGGNDPIAYLGIHGVADSVLNYSLGEGLRDHYLKVNGCAAKSAPTPKAGSGSHIKTTYSCSKAPVTWIAHSGNHVSDPKDNGASSSWAPGETWKFFTQVA